MKKTILILGYVCLFSLKSYSLDSTKVRLAKHYLDKIYEESNQSRQYIKALAYTYSENDLAVPNDKGEFIIARKGSCGFQQFKSILMYSDAVKSVQIDTLEKTVVVSGSAKPIGYLNSDVLNDVSKIEIKDLSSSVKMLVMEFNSGSPYDKVELVFDTASFHLQKMNLWFRMNTVEDDAEIRKMEIKYLEISDKIPDGISVCSLNDIIDIDRTKGIVLKSKAYSGYELIDLLSK